MSGFVFFRPRLPGDPPPQPPSRKAVYVVSLVLIGLVAAALSMILSGGQFAH